jgi:uroporphyrinogen decarboxylase
MAHLTTRERVRRMYDHLEADRIPIWDTPWASTLERWQREGLPKDMAYCDYFDLDQFWGIGADNSPRFEARVIEETDAYIIQTTGWGATLKNWKHAGGTPDFLDFTIVDRESWEAAKARMTPSHDRIDWPRLEKEYAEARSKGAWIVAHFWFGFDVTHSWMVGTERLLMAIMTDPDWCADIFKTCLDLNMALFQMVLDAGYEFDEIYWPDDMGYKGHQFFSVDTYREILKPLHKQAVDWAHERGVRAHLHSCGDIRPFLDDLVEIGIDGLNPIEVKAGMDPVALKKQYGDLLLFHGGINAVLWDDLEAIEAEMRKVIPALRQNGGYIFSSDHSVPDNISLENFRRITDLAKELGSY